MEKSEEWSKRQKQELLHRIKELETEVERLKKLTPQELINEVESYKEVTRLKTQLEKLNSQQSAQIEVKNLLLKYQISNIEREKWILYFWKAHKNFCFC